MFKTAAFIELRTESRKVKEVMRFVLYFAKHSKISKLGFHTEVLDFQNM